MKEWFDLLRKAQGFQWDAGNSVKNSQKHQVSCEEAEEVFFNRPLLLLEDVAHSKTELRLKALGKSNNQRLLIISFTVRNEWIRVISARAMNQKEKKHYEKEND